MYPDRHAEAFVTATDSGISAFNHPFNNFTIHSSFKLQPLNFKEDLRGNISPGVQGADLTCHVYMITGM